MRLPGGLFCLLVAAVAVRGKKENEREERDDIDEDANVDIASAQLYKWRDEHKKPMLLSTSAGKPVDLREVFSLNSDVLTDAHLIDNINNIVNERIPNREVNAKGTGAFGYLEVTDDITKYTKAKLFEKVGKRTPLFVRLGTSQAETGGSDLEPLGLRGFSLKMYTEEGNLDFLNIQIPVFFFKDPQLFTLTARALRRNPKNYLKDFTAVFDFLTLEPGALHAFLWMASEFGLPRGFRKMNGFPIHTYEIYNEKGEKHYVRFKFLTEQGYDSFTLKEAVDIGAIDPDFFIRDVYNAIENKDYPSWRMEMDVFNDINNVEFDPFDVTRQWKNGTYHTIPIGRVVLDKNIENHFAQVEQAGFNPNHLVPGISGPRDHLFRGRVIAYTNAQTHRLGINNHKIEINRPRCPVHNFNRDGLPPVMDNMRDAPNYYPDSFNGPEPTVDLGKPGHLQVLHSNAVDLEPAREFYKKVLKTNAQKQRLIDNMVDHIIRVPHPTQDKFIDLLRLTDEELATRFSRSLDIKKETTRLPNVVDDIKKVKRDVSEL